MCPGLREIPASTFDHLPYLRQLNLHDNGLDEIEPTAADWSTLDWLDVARNPLVCDCRAAWINEMFAAAAATGREDGRLAAAFCAAPAAMAGKRLGRISKAELERCIADDDAGPKMSTGMVWLCVLVSLLAAGLVFFAIVWLWKTRRTSDGNSGTTTWTKPRLKRPKKGSIAKSDITVVPESVKDSSKYLDVLPEEHLYEELPLAGANFPDVKTSVL